LLTNCTFLWLTHRGYTQVISFSTNAVLYCFSDGTGWIVWGYLENERFANLHFILIIIIDNFNVYISLRIVLRVIEQFAFKNNSFLNAIFYCNSKSDFITSYIRSSFICWLDTYIIMNPSILYNWAVNILLMFTHNFANYHFAICIFEGFEFEKFF
jgi:hypothetical protein